jgi:transcriptional regulator with XRE-family HTH domain
MSTNIFFRLREERERLGKTQEEFALAAGVTRRPYAEWERPEGKTSPTAHSLVGLAALGADVLYILTGKRSQAMPPQDALPPRQRVLLENWQASDEAGRKVIEGTAFLAAKPSARRA